MALRSNREIFYSNPVEWIEHKTGKKVKAWRQCLDQFGHDILFVDGTFLRLHEGAMLDDFKYEPIPKQYCTSCGEDAHISNFDGFGRCQVTLKKFWNKARKVYWHRYLKNK